MLLNTISFSLRKLKHKVIIRFQYEIGSDYSLCFYYEVETHTCCLTVLVTFFTEPLISSVCCFQKNPLKAALLWKNNVVMNYILAQHAHIT